MNENNRTFYCNEIISFYYLHIGNTFSCFHSVAFEIEFRCIWCQHQSFCKMLFCNLISSDIVVTKGILYWKVLKGEILVFASNEKMKRDEFEILLCCNIQFEMLVCMSSKQNFARSPENSIQRMRYCCLRKIQFKNCW